MKKCYKVIYEVKCYEKESDTWYKVVESALIHCQAQNKIEAINTCIEHYQWGEIYKEKAGFYPAKMELNKIVDVILEKGE